MKEIIPGLGDRTARDRLDELFSRETLGAVLFGSAASKVVEKINTIAVIAVVIYLLGIEVGPTMWVIAILLLFSWSLEFLLFIYLYVRWEQALETVEEATDKAKDKASETKEKAKEKKDEVTSDE